MAAILERLTQNLLDEDVVKHFTTFANVGQNVLGVRRRLIGEEIRESSGRKGNLKVATLELYPDGPRLYDFKPLVVHVTVAGVPHRVPHSFGYWHINDMDEVYLPLPGTEPDTLGHFIVLMQRQGPNEGESFAWYCGQCYTLMHESRYDSGQFGIAGFWKAEAAAVRRYNSDEAHRTCPECGTINPRGYCAERTKDSPGEAAARLLW
jgi:hypothetical protein